MWQSSERLDVPSRSSNASARLPGWAEIRQQRTDDLLVYLALARFRKRPPLSKLPGSIRRDIKEFFGAYKRACERADALLFRAGDATAIDEACCRSTLGKLLPNALYVHRSALDRLEPLLRVYEGCARAYLGEMEGANIIKLHRFSGKVSYLFYPSFDAQEHPALLRAVKVSLRSLQLDCYDYGSTANPPILHRKETFVPEDYPGYATFATLTREEEERDLLTDTARIGTRLGKQTAQRGSEDRGTPRDPDLKWRKAPSAKRWAECLSGRTAGARDRARILHEPERLRFVGILEDLEVAQALLLASEFLKFHQATIDAVAVQGDGCGGRDEWLLRPRLKHVGGLGVVEGDLLDCQDWPLHSDQRSKWN